VPRVSATPVHTKGSAAAVTDPIKTAIQTVLDQHGDGWTCSDFVVAIGLERVDSDGELETMPWWYAPKAQAEWVTDGLIIALDSMRNPVEAD
jgi:hypothetical protein